MRVSVALVGLGILDAGDAADRGKVTEASETLLFAASEGFLDINADGPG